jgi:small subunit ribosomal protein S4
MKLSSPWRINGSVHRPRLQTVPQRGMKLYLKGDRCLTKKCAIERRPYPPASPARHAAASRPSMRCSCGRNRRFGVFTECWKVPSVGLRRSRSQARHDWENLLQLLELRFDNVVYRMGYASSRDQARQLVTHAHFRINGQANIPLCSFVQVTRSPWTKEVQRRNFSVRRQFGSACSTAGMASG